MVVINLVVVAPGTEILELCGYSLLLSHLSPWAAQGVTQGQVGSEEWIRDKLGSSGCTSLLPWPNPGHAGPEHWGGQQLPPAHSWLSPTRDLRQPGWQSPPGADPPAAPLLLGSRPRNSNQRHTIALESSPEPSQEQPQVTSATSPHRNIPEHSCPQQTRDLPEPLSARVQPRHPPEAPKPPWPQPHRAGQPHGDTQAPGSFLPAFAQLHKYSSANPGSRATSPKHTQPSALFLVSPASRAGTSCSSPPLPAAGSPQAGGKHKLPAFPG